MLAPAAMLIAFLAAQTPDGCAGPEFRQFDFWIGDWVVMVRDTQVAGTNRITPILGGCALREEWRGTGGSRGESVNAYDRAAGRWRQTWVADDGTVLLLEGALVEGRMVLTGRRPDPRRPAVTLRDRITWSPLERGEVRQLWEISEDDGASWRPVFDGRYVRKRDE